MAAIETKGLRDLEKKLRELPAKIEKKLMRGALRAGAVVYREAARANAPVAGGDLRRSIKVGSTNVKRGQATAKVTAGDKKAYYAHIVEFGSGRFYTGTKRRIVGDKRKRRTADGGYIIKPSKKKALVIAGQVRTQVVHPGSRPQPFMRPAFDSASENAIAAFADYLRQRIPTEALK